MRSDEETRERGDAGEPIGGGRHVAELLDAYRTGELDADERARVEGHVEACSRCREELAALASWAAAVERGYEASRAAAAALEPDWAAQRSAIVERTSGRTRARSPLARWAPQVALVAVAALIVGIVWRQNPIDPEDLRRAPSEPATADVREGQDAAASVRRDPGAAPETATRNEETVESETPSAPSAEAPEVRPPAPVAGAAQSAAADGQRRERAGPPELEKQALPEEDEARLDNLEALADRAAEPARAAAAADVERFTRQARAALRASDTAGARRALALWSDTLRGEGYLAGPPEILADTLRQFLESAE